MPNDRREQEEHKADASFADILNEFEKSTRAPSEKKGRGKGKGRAARPSLQGTVVGLPGDFVLVDYGGKSEGVISKKDLLDASGNLSVKPGDTFDVAITGFNNEGLATLSRVTGPRPRDWDALSASFRA
jgi:small subunit ribosomal protein S1